MGQPYGDHRKTGERVSGTCLKSWFVPDPFIAKTLALVNGFTRLFHTQESLEKCRSLHDVDNQNLEANLDVVLDRLRQGASEEVEPFNTS